MTNKLRAILHFAISLMVILILTIFLICIFVVFDNTGQIGSQKNTSETSGIAFGLGILTSLLLYTIITFSFSKGSKPSRTILPIILSTLAMSMLISLIMFGFDSIDNTPEITPVFEIISFILLIITSLFLLFICQTFNTKFLLISTSNGISDEWEMLNFFNLLKTGSNITHKNELSFLKSKNKTLIIKFISAEQVERKVQFTGDIISKDVSEIMKAIEGEDKGVIVYLSNKLPETSGELKNIKVIKNEDLFKTFKLWKKGVWDE